MQATVCVHVCVRIQYPHPRSTPIRTGSGRQAHTTTREIKHLLWLFWLKAKAQPTSKETDGSTVYRNWTGKQKCLFRNRSNYQQRNKYICLSTDAHVITACMQGSAWQQPDMWLQAEMVGGVDASYECHTGWDLLQRPTHSPGEEAQRLAAAFFRLYHSRCYLVEFAHRRLVLTLTLVS